MSIKFENTKVMNFEGALRGMRNPLESWDKSDSGFCIDSMCESCLTTREGECFDQHFGHLFESSPYLLGENDKDLALRLIKSGSDHSKFMRQIFISVDITAPLYWWKEFDTYKVGTVANSTSTMHKLGSREVTAEDFSFDDEEGNTVMDFDIQDLVNVVNEYITYWKKCKAEVNELQHCVSTVEDSKRIKLKERKAWRRLIQTLPDSFLQTRTVTLNYQNARAIAHSDRKNHKQIEWRVGFMTWLKSLPYSDFIFCPSFEEEKLVNTQQSLVGALDTLENLFNYVVSGDYDVLFLTNIQNYLKANGRLNNVSENK